MRQKRNRQRSIVEVIGKHPGPKEVEWMSLVLDAKSEIDEPRICRYHQRKMN